MTDQMFTYGILVSELRSTVKHDLKAQPALCGSGSCRINSLCFLAGWCKRRLNQILVAFGLVYVYVCRFLEVFF